jgi:RHS repeat-associated protein
VQDENGNSVEDAPLLSTLFQGRELDAETGLYYYRARYYSPRLGRFISHDPMDYVDGMNMYQFVRGNPVNWVDPFGTTSQVLVEKITESMEEMTEDERNANIVAVKGGVEGFIEGAKKQAEEYGENVHESYETAKKITEKTVEKIEKNIETTIKEAVVPKIEQVKEKVETLKESGGVGQIATGATIMGIGIGYGILNAVISPGPDPTDTIWMRLIYEGAVTAGGPIASAAMVGSGAQSIKMGIEKIKEHENEKNKKKITNDEKNL